MATMCSGLMFYACLNMALMMRGPGPISILHFPRLDQARWFIWILQAQFCVPGLSVRNRSSEVLDPLAHA